MFEQIKKHPYLIGGVILGIIVLFFISSSGGGGAVTSSDSGSDVASAEGIATAQANANAQVALGGLSLQGLQEQIGGAVTVATLQAHTADNANTLAAAVASQQINAEYGSRDLSNTLAAQTEQKRIQSSTDQLSISTAGQVQQTQYLTSALIQQSQIAANVTSQSINAQRDIATQSWFDKIF